MCGGVAISSLANPGAGAASCCLWGSPRLDVPCGLVTPSDSKPAVAGFLNGKACFLRCKGTFHLFGEVTF